MDIINRKLHRRKLGLDEDDLDERQAFIIDDFDASQTSDIDLFDSKETSIKFRTRQIKSDDSSRNDHELHSLQKTRDLISEPFTEFIFYDIKPEDSLHNLSLRYACPVASIKRLNGLISDSEFHALKKIKLPLGKFGILNDVILQQQQQLNSEFETTNGTFNELPRENNYSINSPGSALSIVPRSSNYSPLIKYIGPSDRPEGSSDVTSARHVRHYQNTRTNDQNNDINIHILQDTDIGDYEIVSEELQNELELDAQQTNNSVKNYVESVFENLDQHVVKAKEAIETSEHRTTDIIKQLVPDQSGTSDNPTSVNRSGHDITSMFLSCNDGDFGLNIKCLLTFIFVVCLIGPLVYFIYVEDTHEQHLKSIENIANSSKHLVD